jgi:hypothetical protein
MSSLSTPLPVLLATLFLNGVNIDGLRDQTFEKCRTVRIDDKGDVHLDCPAYEVEGQAPSVTPPASTLPPPPLPPALPPAPLPLAPLPGAQLPTAPLPFAPLPPFPAAPAASLPQPPLATQLTRRYFLVSELKDAASAQYDVDLYVNSRWVKKVRSGEEQLVLEITKLLLPGSNKVLLAPTKHMEAGRKGSAPSSFVRLVIGEGDQAGGKVLIDNPIIDFKRTAAETENVNEEFTLQAR